MAINVKTEYPDNANAASLDYTTGSFRNDSTPSSEDGTPLEVAWMNDFLGSRDAILKAGGITPSGDPETAQASDVLNALKNVIKLNSISKGTAGGTPNAITVTTSPSFSSLSGSPIVVVSASNRNTSSSVTFSPNGLTAKPIKMYGGESLVDGAIYGSSHKLILMYDEVSEVWELLNPAARIDEFLHVQDQKPTGTDGGTYTGGTWETRVLNTVETNTISGASLSSNQITLPAGEYYFEASSIGFGIGKHKSVIYDITNSENLLIGTSEMSSSTTSATTSSRMDGRVTIGAETDLEIRTYGELTRSTDGLGTSSGSGLVEIYSDVKIWRLS